jgi:pyruvate/2-oxoglutarate dehydrogenase complex dihydrolipoamide dehydrogenase (E3) component
VPGPQSIKQRAIDSHMSPAAGFFMREKIEGRIPMSLGRSLTKAEECGGRVLLTLGDGAGKNGTLAFDHVIAATGYRPNMRRMPFLPASVCDRITAESGSPVVSDSFETPVAGLFVTGPAAMSSFGPLMRFMVGAEFAAPRVAARLERRLGGISTQRAA